MTNKKFNNLFDADVRDSKIEKLSQFHMDIAGSIQKVTEEIMIKLAKSIRNEYGIKNLCLAGGVALNCVANGKIIKEKSLIKFGFNRSWRCWRFFRCSFGTLAYRTRERKISERK